MCNIILRGLWCGRKIVKAPNADGDFSKSPIFNFNDDKLKFNTNDVSNANDNYGSVSAFVPKYWCLNFEVLSLLTSWYLNPWEGLRKQTLFFYCRRQFFIFFVIILIEYRLVHSSSRITITELFLLWEIAIRITKTKVSVTVLLL